MWRLGSAPHQYPFRQLARSLPEQRVRPRNDHVVVSSHVAVKPCLYPSQSPSDEITPLTLKPTHYSLHTMRLPWGWSRMGRWESVVSFDEPHSHSQCSSTPLSSRCFGTVGTWIKDGNDPWVPGSPAAASTEQWLCRADRCGVGDGGGESRLWRVGLASSLPITQATVTVGIFVLAPTSGAGWYSVAFRE